MPLPARAFALATVLSLLLAGVGASVVSAQPDTTALEFLGFRAGARLEELNVQVQRMKGGSLRCRRSKVDPRVMECRAALQDPELARVVALCVSAIDSSAGVITLSGAIAPEQLDRWRWALQQRYGTVGPKVQGTQSMLQWVRRGRMLRLTWRLEGSGKVASVSLVDGRVLDEWGRNRGVSPATRATPRKAASSRQPDQVAPLAVLEDVVPNHHAGGLQGPEQAPDSSSNRSTTSATSPAGNEPDYGTGTGFGLTAQETLRVSGGLQHGLTVQVEGRFGRTIDPVRHGGSLEDLPDLVQTEGV
jgi:hypothetical protein